MAPPALQTGVQRGPFASSPPPPRPFHGQPTGRTRGGDGGSHIIPPSPPHGLTPPHEEPLAVYNTPPPASISFPAAAPRISTARPVIRLPAARPSAGGGGGALLPRPPAAAPITPSANSTAPDHPFIVPSSNRSRASSISSHYSAAVESAGAGALPGHSSSAAAAAAAGSVARANVRHFVTERRAAPLDARSSTGSAGSDRFSLAPTVDTGRSGSEWGGGGAPGGGGGGGASSRLLTTLRAIRPVPPTGNPSLMRSGSRQSAGGAAFAGAAAPPLFLSLGGGGGAHGKGGAPSTAPPPSASTHLALDSSATLQEEFGGDSNSLGSAPSSPAREAAAPSPWRPSIQVRGRPLAAPPRLDVGIAAPPPPPVALTPAPLQTPSSPRPALVSVAPRVGLGAVVRPVSPSRQASLAASAAARGPPSATGRSSPRPTSPSLGVATGSVSPSSRPQLARALSPRAPKGSPRGSPSGSPRASSPAAINVALRVLPKVSRGVSPASNSSVDLDD